MESHKHTILLPVVTSVNRAVIPFKLNSECQERLYFVFILFLLCFIKEPG